MWRRRQQSGTSVQTTVTESVESASPSGEWIDPDVKFSVRPILSDRFQRVVKKKSVKVRWMISANDRCSVEIIDGLGNNDADIEVLNALRRWAWSSAKRNGFPVESTVVREVPVSFRSEIGKDGMLNGNILVHFSIKPDGSSQPKIIVGTGNSNTDKVIIDTLRKWTWKPATRNGKPVDSTVVQTIHIEVKNEKSS
jgi:hypothetical protein